MSLSNSFKSLRINIRKKLRDADEKKLYTGIFAVLGVLLVGLGLLSFFYTQQAIQERQELRRQAARDEGIIEITAEGTPAPAVGEAATLTLKIDTAGVQTDGVQTVLTLSGTNGVTLNDVTLNPLLDNLDHLVTRTEDTADGVQITYAGLNPIDSDAGFSSDTPIGFLEVTAKPSAEGSIRVSFDNTRSKSTNRGTGEDALQTIQDVTFVAVQDDGDVETTEACVVGGCNGTLCLPADEADDIATTCRYREEFACYEGLTCARQADGECGFTEQEQLQQCLDTYEDDGGGDTNDDDNTDDDGDDTDDGGDGDGDDDDTETSDNDEDDDGTGGIEVAQCDERCSANADCAVNLRCYQGACRLATNPESSSCSPASTDTSDSDDSSTDDSTTAESSSTETTINYYYPTNEDTTISSTANKGDDSLAEATLETATTSATNSATPSPDTTSGSMDTDSDSFGTSRTDTTGSGDQSLLGMLVNTTIFGVSLPLAIIGLGLGLAAIGLLYYATTQMAAGTATTATGSMANTTGSSATHTTNNDGSDDDDTQGPNRPNGPGGIGGPNSPSRGPSQRVTGTQNAPLNAQRSTPPPPQPMNVTQSPTPNDTTSDTSTADSSARRQELLNKIRNNKQ